MSPAARVAGNGVVMDVPDRLRIAGKTDWESLLIWGWAVLLALTLLVALVQSLRAGDGFEG